jgi:cephalosporin-C deacetylase-like acetyl esterase
MPANAKKGSLPIVVTLQGASSRSALKVQGTSDRSISICPNPHGIPNGQNAAYYKELNQGLLKNYTRQGVDSRDHHYFKGMILRDFRAVQFAKSLPEWNGQDIVVHGSSQGGGRAMFVCALDPDVTLVSATVPALTDHCGAFLGRRNGWPQLFKAGPDRKPLDATNAVIAAMAPYFDTVNFADRVKAEVCLSTGFLDTTCPPSCAYALYNALPAGVKKVMTPYPKKGHNADNSVGMRRLDEVLGR